MENKTDRPSVQIANTHELDAECWKLHVRGGTDREIAQALDKSLEWASETIQRQADQKQSLPVQSVKVYVEKLVDEINLIRQAAWSGWERSQLDKVRKTQKTTTGGTGGGKEESTVASEGQAGDTAFLRIIAECNKREAALRGIEKLSHSLLQVGRTNVDIDTLFLQVEAANSDAIENSPGRNLDSWKAR